MQKSDNFLLLLGGILLAIFPEVLILSLVVMFFFRKLEFNHIYVLITLAVLIVIVIMIYPNYLYTPVQTAFINVKNGFERMTGADNDFSLFKFLFGYSFLGHLFLLHTSAIIVLVAELVLKDRLEVETFSKATQMIRPKKPQNEMPTQKTLIVCLSSEKPARNIIEKSATLDRKTC